jgi:hypothetical protein
MLYLPKLEITNLVIVMSPLRKLALFIRPTLSRVSFNHFPRSTNLLLSFRMRSWPSQTFLRLTTRLGALGRCLAIYEVLPPRVRNASWMLDTAQSVQGLNSSAHTENSPPNSRIFHKGLGSHKERLGQVKRLLKGDANGRGGGVLFIGIWKTSHWSCQSRLVHHTGQTGRVTPNRLRPLTDENSLRW